MELNVCGDSGRPDSHVFERKLRCAVPPILRLAGGWETAIQEAKGLETYSFQLQQVERKHGHWELIYGAWEDHGSGRQVAEIRVIIGRTGTLDHDVGVAASVRCFAPAIKQSSPLRGALLPQAKLELKASTSGNDARWMIPAVSSKCDLQVVGSDPCPSQRVQVGLTDEAGEPLKKAKIADRFVPKVQSRNNWIRYHPKWKTWPGTLSISGDKSGRVNGTYQRLACQHTIAHSALWRRKETADQPALYVLFRPDVVRCGLDVAVVSMTPSYRDGQEVCELCDWIPENALEPETHSTQAKFREFKEAPSSLQVQVMNPNMIMNMKPESFHERLCGGSADNSGEMLCELTGLSAEVVESLLEYNRAEASDGPTQLDLVGRSRARNGKRLSILAAPTLLKLAAEGKLPLTFSEWYRFPSSWSFGTCQNHVPSRPLEKWRAVEGRKMKHERFYDPEESNEYYQVSWVDFY